MESICCGSIGKRVRLNHHNVVSLPITLTTQMLLVRYMAWYFWSRNWVYLLTKTGRRRCSVFGTFVHFLRWTVRQDNSWDSSGGFNVGVLGDFRVFFWMPSVISHVTSQFGLELILVYSGNEAQDILRFMWYPFLVLFPIFPQWYVTYTQLSSKPLNRCVLTCFTRIFFIFKAKFTMTYQTSLSFISITAEFEFVDINLNFILTSRI